MPHVPGPSLAPLMVGAGITLLALGVLAGLLFLAGGALLLATGLTVWVRELYEERKERHA